MGFWDNFFRFAAKVATKLTLLFSGVQIGDSVNDSVKVSDAIKNYEVQRNAVEQYYYKEDTKMIQYIVIVFIIAVVLLVIVFGVKMLLDKKQTVPSIALTTLREGSRTVPSGSAP